MQKSSKNRLKYAGRFLDSDGVPVQENSDRGDTLFQLGLLAIQRALNPCFDQDYARLNYDLQLSKFKCPDRSGVYKRYHKPVYVKGMHKRSYGWEQYEYLTDWHMSCHNMTEDQATPNVIAWGFYNMHDNIADFCKGLVKRWGFMANTVPNGHDNQDKKKLPDPAKPGIYACLIRSGRWYPWYPVLIVLDALIFLDTLQRCVREIFSKKTRDDINATLVAMQGKYIMPTPFNWLSRKLLKKVAKVQRHWDHYFYRHGEFGQLYPFEETFKDHIKEM